MSEQDPQAFVRQLLAREERVSEESYRSYRQRLDREIAAARPLRKRVRWVVAAAAVAASVLALLIWRPWRAEPPADPNVPGPQGERLVVLAPPSRPAGQPEPAPYEQALKADLIATATAGKPLRHAGKYVVPLRLERVLKQPAAPRKLPSFACPVGDHSPMLDHPTKDARVLVYLSRQEEGWGLLDLCWLDEQGEAREVAGVERFLQVAGACRSDDPSAAYRRLLAPEAGGLDAPACKALTCSPDPRAAGPVAECARRLPRGQREQAYKSLPDLCRSADAPTREAVRRLLIEEVEGRDPAAADYIAAVQALGQLADQRAFDVLNRQQRRQPPSALNVHAARALKEAGEALGPAGRDQARQAWLALLGSPRSAPVPSSRAERDLVAEVVRLLRTAGLSEAERKLVRQIRDGRGERWFKDALELLTR